jgi:preprotein translocase subunit SecF
MIKFKAAGGNAVPEGGERDGLEANTQVIELESAIRGAIGGFTEQRVEYVGPRVGAELREDGAKALLYSAIMILAYVAFRFNSRFAPGAVVAVVHDLAITAGILVMMGEEFDLRILAAMLAILGYSLNDTIIIYDRIRENMELRTTADLEEVLNASVNQTLSRTFLTSITTMLALLSLYFLGGNVIQSFAKTMLIGVVVGTYSSVFIASPLLLFLETRYGNADGAKKKAKKGPGVNKAARV